MFHLVKSLQYGRNLEIITWVSHKRWGRKVRQRVPVAAVGRSANAAVPPVDRDVDRVAARIPVGGRVGRPLVAETGAADEVAQGDVRRKRLGGLEVRKARAGGRMGGVGTGRVAPHGGGRARVGTRGGQGGA